MSFQLINVGIAEIQVTTSPNVLRTILGSCVGICLFDPEAKLIGLAHIMLAKQISGGLNPKKYADTAIPILAEEMEKAGALRSRLKSKIAGGSTMFNLGEKSIMGEIGKSNIRKVKEILSSMSIELVAEDTGGDYGRTIDFFGDSFELKIKSIGHEVKSI